MRHAALVVLALACVALAGDAPLLVPTAEEGRRLFARLGITPETTVVLGDT